jgi:hypothetical protein
MIDRLYRLFLLSMILITPAVAQTQLWTGVIDAKRGMNWSQAGIPSGVPDASWPICSTISAYSGNASTINNALSSCANAQPAGGVVMLGAGKFTISGAVNFPSTGHVVLRGQGAGSTTLYFTNPSGSNCGGANVCIAGDSSAYRGGTAKYVHSVTGGLSQGSTSLTLNSASGITANVSAVILTQCDTGYSGSGCTGGSPIDNGGYFECAMAWKSPGVGCAVPSEGPNGSSWRCSSGTCGAAWQEEMFLVTGVSGSTISLNRPLHHPNWSTNQTPQVAVFSPIQHDGVENLTVDSSGDQGVKGSPGPNGIAVTYCYQCWVSGVAAINAGSHDIYMYEDINSLVQGSYTYGNPVSYGDNTGIWVTNGSMNVVQNNICQGTGSCVFADGPEDALVVAYNFATGMTTGSSTSGNLNHAMFTHSAGDNWWLAEGNEWDGVNEDLDHGVHLSMTYFRNFFWGWESWLNRGNASYPAAQYGFFAFSNGYGSRYNHLIGNVLGTPGFSTNYNWTGGATNQFPSTGYIFILGAGSTQSEPSDPLAYCSATNGVNNFTTMCWANWDTAHNASQFNSSEVPTSANSYPNSVPTLGDVGSGQGPLPPSFYLAGRPSWWLPSTIPFPPVGPDVNSGNVGQCSGTLNSTSQAGLPATNGSGSCASGQNVNTAWEGHVNANPAMACYVGMGGLPDGKGNALSFNATKCYGTSTSSGSGTPVPPTDLRAVVN